MGERRLDCGILCSFCGFHTQPNMEHRSWPGREACANSVGGKDEHVEAGTVKDQVALTPVLGQCDDQDMVGELLNGMALYPH